MATDKSLRDSVAIVGVIVGLAVLILANLLADRAFARWDLTSEKRYSLSTPFRNILEKVDQPVKLTYYVSGAAPSWFERNKRDILDKLGEIETFSRGKIKLEVIDPEKDADAKKKLEEEGLKFEVQEMSKDKMAFTYLFTSMGVTYADKPLKLIPVIQRPEDIEYELASRLLQLSQEKKPIIAVHAPKADQPPMMNPMMQQQPPRSGYEWILSGESERERFDVRQIQITADDPIPEGTKLLILVKPKNLNERQRFEIMKYLSSGGRVLLAHAPFDIKYQFGFSISKLSSGLEDDLREIGLTWKEGFVCDNSNLQLALLNMFGQVKREVYPVFVKIKAENVAQDEVITRFLPDLTMPFPSELSIDVSKANSKGLEVKILATTSKESWTEPFSTSFNPDSVKNKVVETFDPPKTVFAKFEGKFPFPWEGKTIPGWEQPDDDDKEKSDKPEDAGAKAEVKPASGMLMVWSCPESFNSTYFGQRGIGEAFQGNMVVLPNIAEAASLGEDLIRIRSKQYEQRPIEKFENQDWKRAMIKWAMIVGMPLALLVFAFSRWVVRKAEQTRYERKFASTIGPSSFSP